MKFTEPPDALKFRVPEPIYIMEGCTPLIPFRGGVCPTCKGLIGLLRWVDRSGRVEIDPRDHYTVCLRCDGMDAKNESNGEALRTGLKAAVLEDTASMYYQNELGRIDLTERERRRIHFGSSRAGYDAGRLEVVNRARIGQAWLIKIGKTPDWTLILDRHGNIIGRITPPTENEDLMATLSVSKTAGDVFSTLPINPKEINQDVLTKVFTESAAASIKSGTHPFWDMVVIALHAVLTNADLIFKSPLGKTIAELLIKALFPIAAVALAPPSGTAQGLVASTFEVKPEIVA